MQRDAKGQEFILTEIDDFNREIELTRHNKALMKLLDARGKQTKTFKVSDVKKQLGFDRLTPQQAADISKHSNEHLTQRRHPRMF